MKKQEWLFVWLAKMFQMPNLFIQSCKMEIRFTEIEFRLSVQSMKIRLVTNFVFFSPLIFVLVAFESNHYYYVHFNRFMRVCVCAQNDNAHNLWSMHDDERNFVLFILHPKTDFVWMEAIIWIIDAVAITYT